MSRTLSENQYSKAIIVKGLKHCFEKIFRKNQIMCNRIAKSKSFVKIIRPILCIVHICCEY